MICHCFVCWCSEMVELCQLNIAVFRVNISSGFLFKCTWKETFYILSLFLSLRLCFFQIVYQPWQFIKKFCSCSCYFLFALLFVIGRTITEKEALGRNFFTYANFILMTVVYISNYKQYVISCRRTMSFINEPQMLSKIWMKLIYIYIYEGLVKVFLKKIIIEVFSTFIFNQDKFLFMGDGSKNYWYLV